MCGIFALLNYDSYQSINNDINLKKEFMKGQKRGPESSVFKQYLKFAFGFHRLAINGLNEASNQPIVFNDIHLICNGEIYNYKELYSVMNIEPETGSDCEVIIHLYIKYGIEQTLRMLDGVFSFILYDGRITDDLDLSNNIYVARDPLGVRPLYVLKNTEVNEGYDNSCIGFASELKCLSTIYNTLKDKYILKSFLPGSYSVFSYSNKSVSYWKPVKENVPYYIPCFSFIKNIDTNNTNNTNNINNTNINTNNIEKTCFTSIAEYLKNAVFKRCLTTERPIACLLSGGLDSSLVCALVNQYYKENCILKQLETYSIGLHGSEDLKYAKIVSQYLGTKHTEIIVTEQEMFDAIPEVIYAIESYDTTTIRASIGNYLLGKNISTNSDAKVIFNGDGSDELCGGYLYMNKCSDDIEFDKETIRLLQDIHYFDVLRSDKCISSHGLEPRTPFLDKTFVNHYLSIPAFYRNHNNNSSHCEKFLLRNSFSKYHFKDFEGKQLLPDSILWRRKEAFSDGVSSSSRSLFTILQEMISEKLTNELNDDKENKNVVFNANLETEKYYYSKIFNQHYPNLESVIPYYWMPKYTNASDPSARTLDIYEKNI
jgi:asparagine synthase (glutamine-hydrolysing)